MSDLPGQAAGGDAPTELSESQAITAIEGLLEEPRQRRKAPPPVAAEEPERSADDESADAGVDESPPTGDEEEGTTEPEDDGDEPEPSAIAPPDSWSDDDKAVFSALPPEAQAVVARRESEREKAFHQKTQEIAEHRKAIQAQDQAISHEREQYAGNLQQLLLVAVPEAQKFAQVDWQQLARDNPAGYVELTAQRDALRDRVGAIQGELQRVQHQQSLAQAQQFAALKAEHGRRLVEALPDFGDPEKGPKIAADIRGYLQRRGFADEEIAGAIDSRMILVAHEAMRAEQAGAARRAAEAKRANPAPTVQRPGSTQRSDRGIAARRNEKMAKLRRTGSQADAMSLLMDML